MAVTKDEVLAKAKELGVTLTEEQIEQFVKDGKLPEETSEQRYMKVKADLEKLDKSDLIDRILAANSEAKDRRLEAKTEKEQREKLEKQLKELEGKASKFTELETELNSTRETLKQIKEAEKKRRELALEKVKDKDGLDYLLNVDAVNGDQFDRTIEKLTGKKNNGADAPQPGEPGETNPFSKSTWNLAEQVKIMKSDPEKAKRLKASAK